MFRRRLSWFAENAEAVTALILSVVVAILGVLGVVSSDAIGNAILGTLAVIAIAILRDRANNVALDKEIRASTAHSREILDDLPAHLDRVEQLAADMAGLRGLVEGISTVRTLRGVEVVGAHAEARKATDRWHFKGGTGTYSRAVTLPKLEESFPTNRRPIQIRIEIIDPTDDDVCRRYETFRRSVSPQPDGTGERWTDGRARVESFATVIAAAWYRQRVRFLDIHLALSATTTTFRYDMFSECLIITQDDPTFPALLVPRERPLYNEYDIELRNSFEQGRHVPLERLAPVPLSDRPTPEEVHRTLKVLELLPQRDLDQTELDLIIEKAVNAPDPYALKSGGGS